MMEMDQLTSGTNCQLRVKIENNAIEVVNSEHLDNEHIETISTLSDLLSNNIQANMSSITHLNLSKSGLKAIILPKLPLNVLILSHNRLSEVPKCLYTNFPAIQTLDLSHNSLTAFDIEPACCESLELLSLNNNQIYNFPHWILTGRGGKLKEVDYSHNLLRNLNTMYKNNIQVLKMRNCRVQDVDYPFFKEIKSLVHLDLSNDLGWKNINTFNAMDELFTRPEWEKLKVLRCNNIPITVLSKGIYYLESLVELHVVGCNLTWIASEIECLVNLEILDVTGNTLCALPKKLGSLERLRIIKATSNKICSIPEIINSNVEVIDLYNNELDDLPTGILDKVRYIDLEWNYLDCTEFKWYEEYRRKRDEFREKYGFVRDTGAITVPSPPASIRSASTDESFDDAGEYVETCFVPEPEDECWDAEFVRVGTEKNSLISESDDEWMATDVVQHVKYVPPVETYVDYDRFLYCDAD